MTTLINASTTAGLVQTADTTGNLSLQSGGTTILALTSAGAAVTGTLSSTGGVSQNVIQRVQGVLTGTYSQASATFTAITSLTATLAALKTTSSLVRITVSLGKISMNPALAATFAFRLMRGSTAIGVGDAAGSRLQATFGCTATSANANYADGGYSFTYLDSPSSTSALTYTLQMATEAGAQAYLNRTYSDLDNSDVYGARTISSILVEEIAG